MALQSFGMSTVACVGFTAVLFPVGFCVFFDALFLDLQRDVLMLNESIKATIRIRIKPKSHQLKKRIGELIQFHCDAKQLSGFFSSL